MSVRRLLATTATILAVLLGGCSVVNPTSPAEQAAMDAITTQIQHTLEQRPDVVSARVTYQNSLDASERADASVKVKGGTDFAPVLDDTERLIWQSRLAPLSSLTIGIVDADNLQRGDVRRVDLSDQTTVRALQARYGPRPVK